MAEWPEQNSRIAGRYLLGESVYVAPSEALFRARTEWNEEVLVSFSAVPDPGTPQGQRAKQFWQRYARSLLQVQSPHVLSVRDLLDEGKWLALVFGARRATTLRELTASVPLAPDLLESLTTALFSGLSAAHQGALLHTQISPEAVWFDSRQQPLLAEFGLARRTARELRGPWPDDFRYAAPELLAGGPYTPQTDLYALAATLLEAVTGSALPSASARQQGVRLPAWPAEVPPQVAHALETCLHLDPASRAVSAAEVVEELQRARPVQKVVKQEGSASLPPAPPLLSATPLPPPPPSVQPRALFPWWAMFIVGLTVVGWYKLAQPLHSAGVVASESIAASEGTMTEDAAALNASVGEQGKAEELQTEVQPPEPEPEELTAETGRFVRTGADAFAGNCAGCHGASAEGGVGPALAAVTDWSQEQFLEALREGHTPERDLSAVMPRFTEAQLSDEEAQNIQAFLGTLAVDVPAPSPEQTPPPEATPVEALPPSEDPITDDEVTTFVDYYLASGSGEDLTVAMNLYADQVQYFDRGVQDKEVLRNDKAGYFKRWPGRTYQRVSEIQTLSQGASTRKVRFNYTYDLTRPGKQLTGQAYTDLGLVKTGGQLFITSETGKIFKELQHSVTTELPVESPSSDRAPDKAGTRLGAPKFVDWAFGGCLDDASGAEQGYLTPGRLQHCAVVIETISNGAVPKGALFNYELEYEEGGETQKFAIDTPDIWPSQTDGALATTLVQNGSTLVFTVPLTVRERSDRSYTQINVIGTVAFDNGSEKNVYVKVPIY